MTHFSAVMSPRWEIIAPRWRLRSADHALIGGECAPRYARDPASTAISFQPDIHRVRAVLLPQSVITFHVCMDNPQLLRPGKNALFRGRRPSVALAPQSRHNVLGGISILASFEIAARKRRRDA